MRPCPFSGGTLRSGDVCGRISMPVDGGCGLGGRESVARVGLQRTGLGGVSGRSSATDVRVSAEIAATVQKENVLCRRAEKMEKPGAIGSGHMFSYCVSLTLRPLSLRYLCGGSAFSGGQFRCGRYGSNRVGKGDFPFGSYLLEHFVAGTQGIPSVGRHGNGSEEAEHHDGNSECPCRTSRKSAV